MSDPYDKPAYGLRVQGFGQEPAVHVIGFQRGCTSAEFPTGGAPVVDAAIENTVGAIRAAKAAGVLVLAFDRRKGVPLTGGR